MIHVKIFGVGGSKYLQILNTLTQVQAMYPTPLTIEEVNDIDAIMEHNIDTIPALFVNNHYYHHIDTYSISDFITLLQGLPNGI